MCEKKIIKRNDRFFIIVKAKTEDLKYLVIYNLINILKYNNNCLRILFKNDKK